jgi:hypothetical protein
MPPDLDALQDASAMGYVCWDLVERHPALVQTEEPLQELDVPPGAAVMEYGC